MCAALALLPAPAHGAVGDILNGVASIISAAAPAVTAAIRAKADVKIAQINSEASINITQQTADTAKYIADGQKEVAIAQSLAAERINAYNQDSATYRLERQLDELRDARRDAYEALQEERRMQYEYDQARIRLAQEQAEANYKLALTALNTQLTVAGLGGRFSNTENSGSRLTVTRTGMATASAVPATPGSQPSAGQQAGATTEGTESPQAGQRASAPKVAGLSTVPRSRAVSRLLNSSVALGTSVARNGRERGMLSEKLLSGLATYRSARGSTRGVRSRLAFALDEEPTVSSDLSRFRRSVSADYPRHRTLASVPFVSGGHDGGQGEELPVGGGHRPDARRPSAGEGENH